VLPVVLDIARGFDGLRQVDAVVSQRDPNAAQDVSRAGLVVNGIEGGDEVKSARLGLPVEPLRSRAMKLTFLLPRCSAWTQANLMASSDELAFWKAVGQQVQRPPRPKPTSRTRRPSLSRSSSHETKRPAVQGADQAALESCGPRMIEWNRVRHEVFRCRDKIMDISPSSNSSPGVTVIRMVADNLTSASKRTSRGQLTFSKRPISESSALTNHRFHFTKALPGRHNAVSQVATCSSAAALWIAIDVVL
jgi:hypothetical protein